MLTPVPMHHVTVYLMREDGPKAAVSLAESGVFDPAEEGVDSEDLPELPDREYRELYASARRRLDKSLEHLGLHAPPAPADPEAVDEAELRELNDWLGEVWRECSSCQKEQRRIDDEARQLQQLEELLGYYQGLDIDLGLLQGGLRFLDVRIGTVPSDELRRLRMAVALNGYTLTELTRSERTVTVALAGMGGTESELDSVLQAASFRKLQLPPEFQAHPEEVRVELDRRREQLQARRQELQARVDAGRKRHGEDVRAAAQRLAVAESFVSLSEGLRCRGSLSRATGWVPSDRLDSLRDRLQRRLGGRHVLQARVPEPAERGQVPSVMRYPRWLQPFATLVRNYGVPRYGEFDPTWLFAITFVLMFGMMFGDIGHGLVIAAGGVALRRRLRGFAPFVVAAGLSSTVFGVVYGSLFGYEEVIHPLWMSPLSNPTLMLELALYWGVAFILLATALTIRNRVAEGRWGEALLDGTGLAGLLLYVGLLYAAYRWVEAGDLGTWATTGVVLPLAAVLGYKWATFQAPLGERLLVVGIEGFETLMSYVTNTLSFLRVAAFSLNHVALAVAVFTLAGMMDAVGHWITVVLGNVFILVLEGAIVAIQVLRLEYYEGFSRFFSGDGREFRPLSLAGSPVAGRTP